MGNQELERQVCVKLKKDGLTRKQIAEQLGISERQVKRRLSVSSNGNVNRTQFGRDIIATGTVTTGNIHAASLYPSKLGLEESYFIDPDNIKNNKGIVNHHREGRDDFSFPLSKDESLYRYEQGDKKREEIKNYIESKYSGKKVKILYLADLHIPFTMYKEVVQIVKEHKDADIVVINGDLLDLFAVSKFAKDKEVALSRELEEGREFLEFISKKFGDVIITEGNHERRLRSYIKAVIPPDMQFLFPDDILQMVQSGEVLKKDPLKNVHIVGSWWIGLFNTIFAHPDNYSSANLRTVQNTSEYFSLIKGIPHRACIIGHTHKAGKIMSGDVLLMETGCLCHDMDYHNGSNFTRTKWTRAYAIIDILPNGNPDFNGTDVVIIQGDVK